MGIDVLTILSPHRPFSFAAAVTVDRGRVLGRTGRGQVREQVARQPRRETVVRPPPRGGH